MGRAVGLFRNYSAHGNGKFDLSCAERVGHPARCVPSGRREVKYVRRHRSGYVGLMAWRGGELLGCVMVGPGFHRSVGTLFSCKRSEAGAG